MKGIFLKAIDEEKFVALFDKVSKIDDTLTFLVEKEKSEKISPEVAAEEANVSKQTIYLWIKKGYIPASKIGRKLLIRRLDLENALKEVKSLKYKR